MAIGPNETVLREIYDRYAMHDPGDEWPKYLEIQRWMEINLKRVREFR